MAFKADWPDMKYGFWVALGVIAALALLGLVRKLLGGSVGALGKRNSAS